MLAVMVPTYNEAGNIKPLVSAILKAWRGKIAVIIVDDDSPDGTGKIADKLAKSTGKVFAVHRKERGRGTAGIRGFREALKHKPDYIIEMDADFSHDPAYIPALVETAKKYDIAIGSRMAAGGRTVNRSLIRNALSLLGAVFTRILLGVPVRDVQSGFKCYRAKVISSMRFDNFVSRGYSIGAEILYRARKQGFTMSEIPIVFANRKEGKSKVTVKEVATSFVNVVRIRMAV